ncbi:hypothetical protein ELH50_01300 [Rhizobium ruizarguesonis]|jgi:hypothetical protein|uniref:hypothetical protein n=1 Tax=Rhizobium TaxID=379 RepID=UPI00103032EF|nr:MULTISPECIES: hypothetical protein [Rhizobium]TAU81972.1 hypothetical protein ELI40_01025 [Rhizobium leguminosarum]TBB09832.1 hypothetical protein ELH50_01300 [Rhizobium ruizarguesonis]
MKNSHKRSKKLKTSKEKIETIHKPDEGSQPLGPQEATTAALGALEKEGVVAALRGTKQGIADLLQNTDLALSIKLAVVYGAGLIVENDDDEWNSLCEAEEWIDHPKLKPKRVDALRAVLRLAVGFDGKKADSTVHRYHKALSPLFVEKVPADDIPRRIQEAGGIERMRQSSRRSLEVTAIPPVLAKLHAVTEVTVFKASIKVEVMSDGVTSVKIQKIKLSAPKAKALPNH